MSSEPAPPVFDRSLRAILASGLALLAFFVAGTVGLFLFAEPPYDKTWRVVSAHAIGGRALNVLMGVDLEFNRGFLFVQCALEDILFVLLFFPFCVAGYQWVKEWRFIGPWLKSIRESAHKHRDKVEPFGVAGLLVFVILPFFSTGALVGSVVGYLLGIRTWLILTTVLTGNSIAVGIWVMFFDRLDRISDNITHALLGLAIVVIVAGFVGERLYRYTLGRKDVANPPDYDLNGPGSS